MGRGRHSWLLALGAVAAAQMITVTVLDGATRAGYDSSRNWVSQLALGPRGWLGYLNFALCGAWLTAYAIGLHRHRAHPVGSSSASPSSPGSPGSAPSACDCRNNR
jgi:uncharacterized protein DUF998